MRLSPATLGFMYLLFCFAPLGLALTRHVAAASAWEYGAAGLGLIGLAAMAAQFVTSGRFRIVSRHLGIDKIMAFHKIAAWWVLVALLLHPLAYVVPTWLEGPDLGTERLVAYLSGEGGPNRQGDDRCLQSRKPSRKPPAPRLPPSVASRR